MLLLHASIHVTRVHAKPFFGMHVQITSMLRQHGPTSSLLLLQLRVLPNRPWLPVYEALCPCVLHLSWHRCSVYCTDHGFVPMAYKVISLHKTLCPFATLLLSYITLKAKVPPHEVLFHLVCVMGLIVVLVMTALDKKKLTVVYIFFLFLWIYLFITFQK